MLWVEQPVGTGFSKGPKTATSQEETAADFIKWFKNWQEVFGIKNYKIYVTGESYAGRYVPYISAAMLDQNDTTHYNLSGAMVYDPSIGSGYAQELATAVPLVNANANLFNFNQSFMAELNSLQKSCGYEAYLDEWLVFPAKGVQPTPKEDFGKCNTFEKILDVVSRNNPCFDIYDINAQCPLLWDVLSFPTTLVYTPEGATTYFNRTDVKKALHAPLDVDWEICTGGVLDIDNSPPSIAHAIPQVIEATNRMLIASGDLDMILITNGTLLSIQNMTWHGKTGFQQKPNTPINIQIPDLAWAGVYAENGESGFDQPQGIMGIQHYERGLMWGETYLSGHMQPEFQPRVTYRHLQWVLGRIDTL
jgi:carboxypeptidase D